VNVNPILINNDQYYAEIKNTNTIASVSVEELSLTSTSGGMVLIEGSTYSELMETTSAPTPEDNDADSYLKFNSADGGQRLLIHNEPLMSGLGFSASGNSMTIVMRARFLPGGNEAVYIQVGGGSATRSVIQFYRTGTWFMWHFADPSNLLSTFKFPYLCTYSENVWFTFIIKMSDTTTGSYISVEDIDSYCNPMSGETSVQTLRNWNSHSNMGLSVGSKYYAHQWDSVYNADMDVSHFLITPKDMTTDEVKNWIAGGTPNTNLIPLMNTIYFPETYTNCEVLIIGSTKYFKYQYVILNNFATITINDDNTNISVNNTIYGLSTGTVINNDLTTILNTVYNIPSHNNIPKVLIKYTVGLKNKITSIEFNDQYYPNVLDYATNLQINNNNITYNENNLKISSNVMLDFDNYFTETIAATNEYGTTPLNYNFIKLGYNELVVPNLYTVSMNIYITNTMDIVNIDLREIEKGDNYKLIYNPYSFDKNTFLIDYTLTFTTNSRGIYDILVSIDNKLYVLRVHETESSIDDNVYNIG
jgi:hypothetical protein